MPSIRQKRARKQKCEVYIDNGKETVVILMRHLNVTLSIIAGTKICAQFTYTDTSMNIYIFSFFRALLLSFTWDMRACANWISEGKENFHEIARERDRQAVAEATQKNYTREREITHFRSAVDIICRQKDDFTWGMSWFLFFDEGKKSHLNDIRSQFAHYGSLTLWKRERKDDEE
jgi:hypothetical protein